MGISDGIKVIFVYLFGSWEVFEVLWGGGGDGLENGEIGEKLVGYYFYGGDNYDVRGDWVGDGKNLVFLGSFGLLGVWV